MLSYKRTLATQGFTGKVVALRTGIIGRSQIQHVSSYNSTLSTDSECEIAQAAGIDGFIQMWDGPNATFLHESMLAMWESCSHYHMVFAVMADKWIATLGGNPDPTQTTINAFNTAQFQQVIKSTCYMPEKYIFDFDLGNPTQANVNIPKVQAAFPKYPILSENTGYTWPQINSDPVATLKTQNLNPLLKVPGVTPHGFFDAGYPLSLGVNEPETVYTGRDYNKSVWDETKPVRLIEHQAGGYYFDQLAVTTKNTKYIMLVTWDDFDERTSILQALSPLAGIRVK